MNNRNVLKSVFAGFALLLLTMAPAVAVDPVDTILVNGKIVTVDDRFTIAQAVAIKDGRIVAVGKTADVRKLADKDTKVIDLKGKTVIPGLIDNHAHFVRVAEKWHWEMRLDTITSRKQVINMIADRVKAAKPGEWIVALGGCRKISSPMIRAASRWRNSTSLRRTTRWRCRRSIARPISTRRRWRR